MTQAFDESLQTSLGGFLRLGQLGRHLHALLEKLVIDGVYAADDDDQPQFQVLPAPGAEEIARLTESLALRIREFLQQRGLGPGSDPEEADPLSRDQPWQARDYDEAVQLASEHPHLEYGGTIEIRQVYES